MAEINPNALLEFARTITSGGQSKSGARLATITRIDESGTAYVQLPGGEESPIATTGAAYNIGDVVSVSMYNGKLRTVDNITAPSVSERLVKAAIRPVSKAAELAKAAANEADKVATAINQHFWADDNGIHVTEAEHDATTEHNILINSLGILLRSASNYLVSITQSATAFYDGAGNAASNITAQFGSTLARIGKQASGHVDITTSGMEIFGYLSNTLKSLAMFGSTVRIGPSDGPHMTIYTNTGDSDGTNNVYIDGYNNTSQIFRIRATLHNGLRSVTLMGSDASVASINISSGEVTITHNSQTMQFMRGALSVPGAITTGGHSSSIGSTLEADGDEVSTTSGTVKNLTSISIPAGTWILVGGASFDSNSSGRRLLCFNTTSAEISSGYVRNNGMSVSAASSGATYLKAVNIVHPASSTTYYLVGLQNSGTSLAAEGFIRAVRIA